MSAFATVVGMPIVEPTTRRQTGSVDLPPQSEVMCDLDNINMQTALKI